MLKKSKIKKCLTLAVSGILLIGIPLLASLMTYSSILIIKGDKDSMSLRINRGEVIKLSFIHSVELSRWIEIYEYHNNGLVLVESLTKSLGWGLPSTEANFSIKKNDGETWFAFGMQRHVECLLISISPINDYTVEVADRVVKLEKFGDYVEIKTKRSNKLDILLAEWKLHLK